MNKDYFYLDICKENLISHIEKKKNWRIGRNGKHYSTLIVKLDDIANGRGRDIGVFWEEGQKIMSGQRASTRTEFFRQYKEFKKGLKKSDNKDIEK